MYTQTTSIYVSALLGPKEEWLLPCLQNSRIPAMDGVDGEWGESVCKGHWNDYQCNAFLQYSSQCLFAGTQS